MDIGDEINSIEAFESKRRIQCTNACNDIVFNRVEKTLEQTSSVSLASSAVDALFQFRESDEGYQQNSNKSNSGKSKEKDSSENRDEDRSVPKYHENVLNNLVPKPSYIPKLISSLIGTVEGGHIILGVQENRKNAVRLLRNEDRAGIPSESYRDVSVKDRRSSHGSGDSVAMAAAAAAAAIWSDSTKRRGRLRMTSINDEWDGALRWIASWGNDGTSPDSFRSVMPKRNSTSSIKYSDSENVMRNRQYKGGSRHSSSIESQRGEDKKSWMLFDICNDECIGKVGKPVVYNSSYLYHNNRTNEQLGARRNRLVSSAINASLFWFITHKKSLTLLESLNKCRKLFIGVFGVLLSSLLLIGLKQMVLWWRHFAYKSSVRLLLKEEELMEAKTRKGHEIHNTRAAQKKSSSKKLKGRKFGKGFQDSVSKEGIINKRTNQNFIKSRLQSWETNEDSLVLGQSQNLSCTDHNKKNEFRELFGHGYKEHVSRTNTLSTSSCTTDDTGNDIPISSINSKILDEFDGTNWTENVTKFSKSIKKYDSETKHSHIETECRKTTSDKSISSISKTTDNDVVDSTPKKHEATTNFKENFNQHNSFSSNNQSIKPVPTPEQREQASRQLREFQNSQVQKIINQRMSMNMHKNNANFARHSAKSMSLHSLIGMNASPCMKSSDVPSSQPSHVIFPIEQQEKTIVDPNMSEDTQDDNLVEFATSGLLLSDMLDENEDDIICSNIKVPDKNVLCHGISEFGHSSSVALGDLLSGNYSSSYHDKASSLDPWAPLSYKTNSKDGNNEMKPQNHSTSFVPENRDSLGQDGSCNTCSDFQEYSDANICLKVSAKSFSPSWVEPSNQQIDSSADSRIW